MNDPVPDAATRAERALVALLIAFPSAFRERFGEGLRYALINDYRRAGKRGRAAAMAAWLRAAGAVVVHGWAERLAGAGGSWALSAATGRNGPRTHDREGTMRMEHVVREVVGAVRRLGRRPGFTLGAVATLAVGIGPTTAILSVVDRVLLEPLPYPQPDRLVRIVNQNSPDYRWNISVADFLGIRERQSVFESVAAVEVVPAVLTSVGQPERIRVGRVSASWLGVLGVQPAEGRDFASGEDVPGAEPVVILGSALRDRTFWPDADVLGRQITLDGVPHTVVGVLGPDQATLAGMEADVWAPMSLATPPRRGPFFLAGVARLRPDRDLEDARDELDAISLEIFALWSGTGFRDEQARIVPYPLKELMLGTVGNGLWLMLAGVACVLLIAIANVGSLFLVRATEREGELALRASLGASRGRIAMQLGAEGLAIAAAGGAVGVLLAWLGLKLLVATDPALPRLGEVGLDVSALAVISAVTLGSGVLLGFAGLGRVLSASGSAAPARGRSTATATASTGRLRATVVAAQFAIAFSLTAGASLLIGSLVRLQRVDPGYDPEGVVAMQLSLPEQRYDDPQPFWSELLPLIQAVPGVAAVGVGAALPPGGPGSSGTNNFDLLDQPVREGQSEPVAPWNWASPGFMAALSVPLLRGRLFDESDRDNPPVVVVSEAWARRYYPDGGALGARLYAGGDRSVAMTVIGVVGNVKYMGLDVSDDQAVYEPYWQLNLRDGWLVVRGRAALEEAMVDGVRSAIATLDPELPISNLQTMDERTSDSLARPRQWTVLLGLFAALGLALASIGVYGVLSYYVGTQRKEIGVRIALGAEPRTVRRLILGRGMSVAALGIVVGLGASLAAAGWLRPVVFGLSPRDPVTLATVAIVLMALAALACAMPATRAMRIDPASTLKGE